MPYIASGLIRDYYAIYRATNYSCMDPFMGCHRFMPYSRLDCGVAFHMLYADAVIIHQSYSATHNRSGYSMELQKISTSQYVALDFILCCLSNRDQ
jgi:hypothetical protein